MQLNEVKSNQSRAMLLSAWDRLSAEDLLKIDSLCDRFEKAYLQNSETRIEDHIAGLPAGQRCLVVAELIEIEWVLRQDRGERPCEAEYADRFPDCKEAIGHVAIACESDVTASIASTPTRSVSGALENTAQLPELASSGPNQPVDPAFIADIPSDRCWGHFEIDREIGRGGMGVVYRARDKNLDRDVALKSLTREACQQPHASERFLREAKAAAVVRHPNVVTIYSVEVFNQAPFIAMELIDGITLEAYLKLHGALSPLEVAMLGMQVASGLAAAHKKGLVHRDVKPANILLENRHTPENDQQSEQVIQAKITDFGLARATSETSLTHPNIVVGTPSFMSPEQASGEPADHRSDLFSLGSVLYAACLGKPAFTAETILGILHKVINSSPKPLKELCPAVGDGLSDAIERLMSKLPEDRIQSADDAARLFAEIAGRMSQVPPDRHEEILPSLVMAKDSGHWKKWMTAVAIFSVVLFGIMILRTSDGEFILRTDDPEIAAMFGSNGSIVVEDRKTQRRYTLKRGPNRLPSGNYDLQVSTPDGLQIDTPKFTLTRDGIATATVTARIKQVVEAGADQPGADENALIGSPLFTSEYRWSTPINLDARINTEADECHPTLSGDGRVLIFLRDWKTYQSTRVKTGRAFQAPVLLPGPLNAEGDVDSPYLSHDGLTLVFASSRSGSFGENDLWMCHRPNIDAPFSQPENLGSGVNTEYEESTPILSSDSLTLWFCVFRPGETRQVDLYQASRPSIDKPFSNAVTLPGRVNGPGNDFFPRPASTDLVLFFTATEQAGQQAYYTSRKTLQSPFTKPRKLVFDVDKHLVGTVAPTADGQIIVYDSDCPDGKGGFDLWLVRSMRSSDAGTH